MGWRFRKTIKLAPGIRWTITHRGSTFSFGPRGASISVGKRGTYANFSIPGTGISYRERLDKGRSPPGRAAVPMLLRQRPLSFPPPSELPRQPRPKADFELELGACGDLMLVDRNTGKPADADVVAAARLLKRDHLLSFLRMKQNEINGEAEALTRVHLGTPDSRVKPRFEPTAFHLSVPEPPAPLRASLWARLFRRRRLREEAELARTRYEDALDNYRRERRTFDATENRRRELLQELIYRDVASMKAFLEGRLRAVKWPRPFEFSVGVHDGGRTLQLEVKVPESHQMPSQEAVVAEDELKLSFTDLPVSTLERRYARHVHGMVFRLIGESFAALPVAEIAIVSGYYRRKRPGGLEETRYLLSARVERQGWEKAPFDALPELDVVKWLESHELRREMVRNGELHVVTPFQPELTCAS